MISRVASAWNYDPISRGLKLDTGILKSFFHFAAWNYDPISRGLKPCKTGRCEIGVLFRLEL